MGIKDTLVSLYIKKFVIPGALILDKPGFVNFNVSGKSPMFCRQVIIPESFFNNLETELITTFGDLGKQALYSAGKKFGRRFAMIGNFIKRGDVSDQELANYISIVTNFVEGTYASEIIGSFDIANSKIEYKLKNFVIINKLGFGYFLPLGGTAGLISQLLNDPTTEAVLVGKEGEYYKLLCSPAESLKKMNYPLPKTTPLDDLEIEPEYQVRNQFKEFSKDSTSFKQLLDAKYFDYSKGIIQHENERFFLWEVSGWYLLEKELSQNQKMLITLENSARKAGKNISSKINTSDISKILMATGWGNPQIMVKNGKFSIILTSVPWTKYYKEIKFIILRGLIEGMLSTSENREIRLNPPTMDLTQVSLTLQFKEI